MPQIACLCALRSSPATLQRVAFRYPGGRVIVVMTADSGRQQPLPGPSRHNDAMTGHVLYLVGGAPRVGKSALAQRLLEVDRIPWLPTDVIRTVLRRVLPEL